MPKERYRKAIAFIGKRGSACFWFGAIFMVIGLSYVLGPETLGIQQNLGFLTSMIPLHVWGVFWTTGGLVFLVGSLWKKAQLTAFMFGISIAMNWSAGIAIQTFIAETQRGYVSASIYGLFAALIYLISTWAEPTPIKLSEDSEEVPNG